MTGAIVPAGCDAVVPLEEVRLDGNLVHIPKSVNPEANVRRTGSDLSPGTPILQPGDDLGPGRIALLASQGVRSVVAWRPLRIALIATGTELRNGQLRDSNSLMLSHLLAAAGARINWSGSCGDEPHEILAILKKLERGTIDLIATTGGASGGDHDVITDLARSGHPLDLLDVTMKPGRPLVVGTVNDMPLVGLPGTPGAALVAAMQFVLPLVHRQGGKSGNWVDTVCARLDGHIESSGNRTNFARVHLRGDVSGWTATSAGRQNPANLATLALANGLLVIPESCSVANHGDMFDVQIIPGTNVRIEPLC
jgi:molybdopterin molybdotransferase